MDLLAGYGVGFLGSRLKRLAERMQADAAEVAPAVERLRKASGARWTCRCSRPRCRCC